jgi:hypothetical protein
VENVLGAKIELSEFETTEFRRRIGVSRDDVDEEVIT